ncbi:hypothetical protein [Peribacillus sp. V2I11]|uniref:hypothetical protein n=1 Tax=Peribacillus sp. V2I11 TaxID=3042277 RepID=UPI002789F255|nr:hypothetical protein [Peribacillus sp. V2I11]MDQ0881895.1 hypothetical protein [Peribacillus sp. V2I11]
MTLNKSIAVLSLLVLVGGFLIYKAFFVSSSDSEDTRKTQNNTASYKMLKSQKIIVGKDIDPGYYDIKSLDKESDFFGDKIHKNDVLHAVPFHMNENFSIKGKLEFKPSEFEEVEKKGQKTIIKDPGYYKVGAEIQAGNYVLSRTSHTIRVFVDIKDKTETESLQTIQWEIDENVKKPIEIELENGYNVYIDKTGKDGFISNEGDLILERNNEDSE